MSEKLKTGDYVRITIEGEFRAKKLQHLKETGTYGPDGRNWELLTNETDTIVVEKIAPPAEVFGPGDVVRDKTTPSWVYVITEDGYTELPRGVHYNDGAPPVCFTSEYFELVDLG